MDVSPFIFEEASFLCYLLNKLKEKRLLLPIKFMGHIRPRLPNVKPTPQKKANSAKSLHPEGIEFNARLIR